MAEPGEGCPERGSARAAGREGLEGETKPMGETVGSTSGHGGASIPDSSADESLEAWPSPRGTEPNLNVRQTGLRMRPARPSVLGSRGAAPQPTDNAVEGSTAPAHGSPGGTEAEAAKAGSTPNPTGPARGTSTRNHLVGASRSVALQLATPREWTSRARIAEEPGASQATPDRVTTARAEVTRAPLGPATHRDRPALA